MLHREAQNITLFGNDLSSRMTCPQANTANPSGTIEHRPWCGCVREVLDSKRTSPAGNNGWNAVFVCRGCNFWGPGRDIQKRKRLVRPQQGARDLQLVETNSPDKSSAGVIVNYSSVTSWYHVKHVEYTTVRCPVASVTISA